MKIDILHFFDNISSNFDLGMSKDITAFLKDNPQVLSYNLTVSEDEKVKLNIVLRDYTHITAKKFFHEFVNFIGYNNFNAYSWDNAEDTTRFKYLTATPIQTFLIEMFIRQG